MHDAIIDFLLQSEPWTAYRTRLDLLDEDPGSPAVLEVRKNMLSHPAIIGLLDELTHWPGTPLNSHKSAGQLFHKLAFIAEIGLNQSDVGVQEIIGKVVANQDPDGPLLSLMNIPTHFGGSGKDQFTWVLCDAPLLTYSLARLGMQDDARIQKAKNYLAGLSCEKGFLCKASADLGKFRGPGKKDDPCPFATLIMLKLMNLFDEDRNSEAARASVESLLHLWENSYTLHPYLFYAGKDFRKLKAPLVWYDILNVADTLSNFEYARKDQRFHDMVHEIEDKTDADGLFTAESVWKAWKDWEFGQKKVPSKWITFLVYRILKRMER